MTNKGNNIAKKGDAGWEQGFKWNKYTDKCGFGLTDLGEVYLVSDSHTSLNSMDSLMLVSTSGAKETGLKIGENHIKCYYTSGTKQASSKTDAKTWVPNFDGDGQSLVGWAHTGVA